MTNGVGGNKESKKRDILTLSCLPSTNNKKFPFKNGWHI
jgi:hypothetical protein